MSTTPNNSPNFCLGKKPFDQRLKIPKLRAYFVASQPPPASIDYSKAVTNGWPMMGNKYYGDCTCAAVGHMIQEWTANNGNEQIVPDNDILAFYNHFAGGNAAAGATMTDVLKYWQVMGLSGHFLTAYAQLDYGNRIQTMNSVYLFGAIYVGVALPNFAVVPNANWLNIPWVVPSTGPVGDAAPNPNNGHCIPAIGYDGTNLYVVTWGALKPMSWEFYNTYMDEAYAVLSQDWINPQGGKAPPGFDLATLQQDLAKL